MTNAALAELAAGRADAESSWVPGGTLGRRAALCASVALRFTTTPARARAVLDICPPEIRDAALALIDELEEP